MFSRRPGARFNRGRIDARSQPATFSGHGSVGLGLLLGALIERLERTLDGELIRLVAPAWRAILDLLAKDPAALHRIDPRKMEELIAAKYDAEGYEVTLTPRSRDLGRDVIAVSKDGPLVKIFDQVKAYAPGNLVTANDVRALMGVVAYSDATKGVVTTTSDFAPLIRQDPYIQNAVADGLELVNREQLLQHLRALSNT